MKTALDVHASRSVKIWLTVDMVYFVKYAVQAILITKKSKKRILNARACLPESLAQGTKRHYAKWSIPSCSAVSSMLREVFFQLSQYGAMPSVNAFRQKSHFLVLVISSYKSRGDDAVSSLSASEEFSRPYNTYLTVNEMVQSIWNFCPVRAAWANGKSS